MSEGIVSGDSNGPLFISFEFPEYCKGCPNMDLYYDCEKMYADCKVADTVHILKCKNEEVCARIYARLHDLIGVNNA